MVIKNSRPKLPSVESRSREASLVIPNDILAMLGPAPLIGTEDPSCYRNFLNQFVLQFDPQEITEWLLVNDLVNVNWEKLRYLRAKATLIRLAAAAQASKLNGEGDPLLEFLDDDSSAKLVIATKGQSKKEGRQLATCELTVEDVFDAALIEKLDQVDHFDKLIERLENRREKLHREFRVHRSLNPETAKQKANAIIDQIESDAGSSTL
jgi:hypothetical protein